jgi:hypothetical protein
LRVLVEAAAGEQRLPSVKATAGFLCGMEFDSLAAELTFFECLGLDIAGAQVEIALRPRDQLQRVKRLGQIVTRAEL